MSNKIKGDPGSIDKKGKQGNFRESRTSNYHQHNDRTHGHDVETVINTYKDNKVVASQYLDSDKKHKEHTVGTKRPKDHNDSRAVNDYQKYQSRNSNSSGGGGSGK
ncbi:MAG: hypothetical protein WC483_05950 [Candidatus Paceibacterota bacterium]|jgi:ribosomal protein S1|nr:hypothetical protein [Candidatus Paceibacterota bacterium]